MLIQSSLDLAQYFVSRRKSLGFTQIELATKAGLKQKTISLFEQDPTQAQITTLLKILSALRLDLNLIPKEEAKSDWDEAW